MRPFQSLLVWQKAHILTLDVYRATRAFPRDERFGLTAQMRTSSSSVPGNISEGCGKRTPGQLGNSLDVASGSLSELEYWLILSRDLDYLTIDPFKTLTLQVEETRKLLFGFTDWIRTQ